jgi:hypothetical protein
MRRNSKSSKNKEAPKDLELEGVLIEGGDLFIGHRPPSQLTPQDEKILQAFQANLLSLISHELRTPLMGVINALTLMAEKELEGVSPKDLANMAMRNAQQLQRSLASLLDLAALESGTFHAKLREVNFQRIVFHYLNSLTQEVAEKSLRLKIQNPEDENHAHLVLGDPIKVERMLDLLFQWIVSRTQSGSEISVRLSSNSLLLTFRFRQELKEKIDHDWEEALIAYEGRVSSPGSAFSGVLQSEEAFLTRTEEGLGGELLLIHEILRLHGGSLKKNEIDGLFLELELSLPRLSSITALETVLSSRMFQASTGITAISLMLCDLKESTESDLEGLQERVKGKLFRASDAVYLLSEERLLALVLEDFQSEHVPNIVKRIQKELEENFSFGCAHAPSDTLDAKELIALARQRIEAK